MCFRPALFEQSRIEESLSLLDYLSGKRTSLLEGKLKHTHRALSGLAYIHLPQSYLRSPSLQPLTTRTPSSRPWWCISCAPQPGPCAPQKPRMLWAMPGGAVPGGRRGTRARLHADAGRGARAASLAAGRAPPRGVATGGAATDSATS